MTDMSNHPETKLTPDDVRAIRAMFIPGRKNGNRKAICEQFGIGKSQVHEIVTYQSWDWVR